MIFKPPIVAKILAGQKTMARVPVRPREDDCPFSVGRLYAVQRAAGRRATAHIKITEHRLEPLGRIVHDLVFTDVVAEGFKTYDQVLDDWEARYSRRDLDEPVWVLAFHLDRTHYPRLLARRSDELYTDDPDKALPDEPEAVDELALARYRSEADAVRRVVRGEVIIEQTARSLGRSVREETLRAARAGVNVDQHLENIRRELDEIRRARGDAA